RPRAARATGASTSRSVRTTASTTRVVVARRRLTAPSLTDATTQPTQRPRRAHPEQRRAARRHAVELEGDHPALLELDRHAVGRAREQGRGDAGEARLVADDHQVAP